MIKNMNDLAQEITRREGGKKNLSIAQVKEVLAHLSDVIYEDDTRPREGFVGVSTIVFLNGERRFLARKS